MEFRNHQHWIRHHTERLRANPLAAFLFTLLFLALLIPLLALSLVVFAVFLVTLPLRVAYAQWKLGKKGPPPPPRRDDDGPGPPPAGPVIDVEVTRSHDVP